MEVQSVKLVRTILDKKLYPAMREHILSFLHVYVRHWHLNPPEFQNKPDMIKSTEKYACPKEAPAEIEVEAKEKNSKFKTKLYHERLFYPPYSTYFDQWEKIADPFRAYQLVEYYSYKLEDFVQRIAFQVRMGGVNFCKDLWLDEEEERHQKLLVLHGSDVNAEFDKDIQYSKEKEQRRKELAKIKQSREQALARLKKSKRKIKV